MANKYFRVPTSGNKPQHIAKQDPKADAQKGGVAHWTLSPLGDEAILQMDVSDANAAVIGNELTLRAARTLSKTWSALKIVGDLGMRQV